MVNQRIVDRLSKRDVRGLCTDDARDRAYLIGQLASIRGVSRKQAADGVNLFSRRYNGTDSCVSNEKQREELAVLITREGFRQQRRQTPFAATYRSVKDRLYDRKSGSFQLSKGNNYRIIDGKRRWKIADTRTKSGATTIKSKIKKAGKNARVTSYTSEGKTHYSVWADNPLDIKSAKQVRWLTSKRSVRNTPGWNEANRQRLMAEIKNGSVIVSKQKPSELGAILRARGRGR